MKVFLLLLLVLVGTVNCLGFYNPQTGRWLNRDPSGEQAFRTLVLREENDLSLAQDHSSTFAFVRNEPISSFDWLGLLSSFHDCSCCQIMALMNDWGTAQGQIPVLKAKIDAAIVQVQHDPSKYPWHTEYMLRRALTHLKNAYRKLVSAEVICDPSSGGAIAKAWPWGHTVTVYDGYWWYLDFVQGATLIHEGTHMGSGLTDAAYFWQNGESPSSTFWVPWSSIASTYDSWIIEGFCIPGYNCPASPTIPPVKRAQKECP